MMIIIIIIFLHGWGRLTCSDIDVISIVSWGVHDLFFLEVCRWGRVSGVWCCPVFQGGWSSFVCIWVSRLVFQRSLVLFLWLRFLFYDDDDNNNNNNNNNNNWVQTSYLFVRTTNRLAPGYVSNTVPHHICLSRHKYCSLKSVISETF